MDKEKWLILMRNKSGEWEEKTDQIIKTDPRGEYVSVVFAGKDDPYTPKKKNIKIYSAVGLLSTTKYRIEASEIRPEKVEKIIDFGDYVRVIQNGKPGEALFKEHALREKNAPREPKAGSVFEYLKRAAEKLPIENEKGEEKQIAYNQYKKIGRVDSRTALSCYLDAGRPIQKLKKPDCVVFPFGMNISQKKAVEAALANQISIIQGPPGTGKTQTILNLIANIVMNNKTVAIVSNNNSATQNVLEKLEKHGLSFIIAPLGKSDNKKRFINEQSGKYPDMSEWKIGSREREKLEKDVAEMSPVLCDYLEIKYMVQEINLKLINLDAEENEFLKYYNPGNEKDIKGKASGASSKRVMKLKVIIDNEGEDGKKIGRIKSLIRYIKFYFYGMPELLSFEQKEASLFLERLYYKCLRKELEEEKNKLEKKLQSVDFEKKMAELTDKSMRLFKASLFEKYKGKTARSKFDEEDLWKTSRAAAVTGEYPVISSSTHSIRSSLSYQYVYDYLIMDEASQVNIVTGVLAASCAKNIVIVGDQKQLPGVMKAKEKQDLEAVWNECLDKGFCLSEEYCCHKDKQSFLSSAIDVWRDKDVPVTLLREHYRCHPKIINFCNEKFYNKSLIVMTEDDGRNDVLSVYTTEGHRFEREGTRVNQRQIDVVKHEVLPDLKKRGICSSEIGIISPYKNQTKELQVELKKSGFPDIEADTVHKFQGREKDAIIISTVDDKISKGGFVDDPNMLNVAVSRAVNSLSVVISEYSENDETLYGDLVKYINYHKGNTYKSKVRSVFDLLYKENAKQLKEYYEEHPDLRDSEYDSENLMQGLIKSLLGEYDGIDCVDHYPLRSMVKEETGLNREEKKYATRSGTHVDFLLYSTISKEPLMGIEVDGEAYHKEGSVQWERDRKKDSIFKKMGVPLLRFRTSGSMEKERLEEELKKITGKA